MKGTKKRTGTGTAAAVMVAVLVFGIVLFGAARAPRTFREVQTVAVQY